MNQEYVYEDEQEAEGLTFKKIGQFIKKAWLRAVVYMVIMALLVTAIAVPIRVFLKSEPIARTTIEYIYKGIEEGKDPNGGTLNTDNIISTTVLAKAVSQAKLGNKIKDVSTLRDAMRVEGVLTDEYVKLSEAAANGDTTAANTLRTYTMYPTRFNIIISDPSDNLDLTDDQAKQLLNKVVACYYEDFQSRYSVTQMFAENAYNLSENDQMEFTDVYDIYLETLESVSKYLTTMSSQAASFVSTANNTTFTQLLSEIKVLNNSYTQFNAYILSNNIWRNRDIAKISLEASKTDIENRLVPLQDYIESLTEQINKIQPNTTTTDNAGVHSVTISYPSQYFTYQERLDEAHRQVRDYNTQLKNIETRLTSLKKETPTDEDLRNKAVQSLASIEEQTTETIQKINATIADYYDTTFVSASVRQTQSPVVTRASMSFSLLVVYAAALIAALLIACLVTAIKISKKKAAEQAAAVPEKAAEAEKTESDK